MTMLADKNNIYICLIIYSFKRSGFVSETEAQIKRKQDSEWFSDLLYGDRAMVVEQTFQPHTYIRPCRDSLDPPMPGWA